MKKVKYFLIDLVICLLIGFPFAFFCDWISNKDIFDWLDMMFGLGSASILMLVACILLARWNKKSKITRMVNTVTIVAIVSTIVYGVFMLLEWFFPNDTASSFTGNWELWFPVSISISTFLLLQEKRNINNLKFQ